MIKNAIMPTGKAGIKMGEYKYKYNQKKTEYDTEYVRTHYDVYNLKMPKGMKELIKAQATKSGVSMNVWLCDLINKELNK